MLIYRRFFSILSMGLAAVLWIGCGSAVPISEVDDAVFEPDLVGQWRLVTPADETGEMLVLKFDAHTYYVELREPDSDAFDDDVIRLRAYITEVEDRAFVNAQGIDAVADDERLFLFYTYTLSPDGLLTITELQDVGDQKIDKFETSEALRAFIRQNLDNDALYGDSMTLMKVKVAG